MNMLRTCLSVSLVAVACCALAAGAATYKWVDKDGKVHYSDQPVAGAQKVDLKPISEVPGFEVPAAADASAAADTPPPAPQGDNGVVYATLLIVNPKQGEELRSAGQGLVLQAQAIPELGSGDRIEYLLDGKVVPQHMPYVDRGTHSLIARVVGANGDTKIGSDEITFIVFQNIAKPPEMVNQPKPKK